MDELRNYLLQQATQREAGLILAESEAITKILDALSTYGYLQAGTYEDLISLMARGQKVFWQYAGGDFQLLYSFISQYPGGIVELFSKNSGATYHSSDLAPGFILLATKSQIADLQKQGYDLLGRTGMTLQVE